jgi:signal transduction histidine kinase/DNA-binding response OmpR family regulator
MDAVRIAAELIFAAILLATVRQYLRRRDPVSRDVALAFSGFGLTIVTEAWRVVFGTAGIPGVIDLLLLLFQPVFVLHLVSLLRPMPRLAVPGAFGVIVVATAAAFLFRGSSAIGPYVIGGSFITLEAVAAGTLVLEARRRRGPGGVQLALAAAATGVFTLALLIAALGALGGVTTVGGAAALGLSLVAAIGYLIAFLPPAPIQRMWHARATVAYVSDLLDDAGRPVADIWARLASFATALLGGTAVVATVAPSGRVVMTAAAGDNAADAKRVESSVRELADLRATSSSTPDPSAAAAGPLAQRLAAAAGARYVGVVPLADGPTAPILVLLSRHRTLFVDTDRALLATLGGHTAVVADRRAALADQEALGARLAATVEALESASKAKSDFMAAMSHELRTPLSAILGFSELIRGEAATGDSTEATVPLEWIEHIHRGGEHLLGLINDVLDLSKVEAGRLDLRPEPVPALGAVGEVIEGVRPLAERKHITITAPIAGGTVLADRGRLRQILYNLLSNAIKYTPDGGHVWVEIGASEEGIGICVADSGVGIPAADQEAVFDEFRQVGDRAGREGGTGLGLALTRRLVEAHGGRIELASEVGRGSRFTAILPPAGLPSEPDADGTPAGESVVRREATASVARSSRQPSSGTAPSAGRPRILLIEDDPSAVRLLREFVEPAGYQVEAVPSGLAGIESARSSPPAAILLDVLLPDIDGWDVLRRLKADPNLATIPVVVATVIDERELGIALGATDYLLKPLDRTALVRAVERCAGTTTASPRRILAVDDDPATLDFVQAALTNEGIDVVTTTDPRRAIERARDEPFDLVICDLLMPEIDGFEVVHALKADDRSAGIPVVLCTAVDLSEADKARLNGQVAGIVAKGSDAASQLRAALLSLMAQAEPARAT